MRPVAALPLAPLDRLRAEVRSASWFAGLGEPLIPGDLADAEAYATALDLGPLTIEPARDWPHAEALLQSRDWSPAWWDREETLRRALLGQAETLHGERALWTALTELTTDAGEMIHGKAATAAARMGDAAKASVHVAAGAASQAVYQLAVERMAGGRPAGESASPFESKFRLFAAGRWPLGIMGSRLILF